jgi:hypothetical protein
MRKLCKPKDEPVAVFLQCVEGVRSPTLRARFQGVTPEIRAAAEAFDAAAVVGALHTLEEHRDVAGFVTEKEMSGLYETKMARRDARGRRVYDALILLAKGVCPLCGQRTVSTLDHHLPSSKFPSLAVTPCNLVPACSDCNKQKQALIPRKAEEQTFHPYFDGSLA